MRTNTYKPTAWPSPMYAFCILLATLFLSCEKDADERSAYFELTDKSAQLEAPAEGIAETYTFRASGTWKIEPLTQENWIKIAPAEGTGDGTFTLTVAKNTTPEDRLAMLTFMVDGRLQDNILEIHQKSGSDTGQETDPYLRLDDLTILQVPETGVTAQHTIRATGVWRVELSDQEADWVNMEPMQGIGDTPVQLTINKNSGSARTINLNFYLDDVLQSNSLPIHQAGATAILNEDFNWLRYGNVLFYETGGETIITNWTADETARGWTSSPSADNSRPVYARQGFVKLGKTNYGADLISPKLSQIQGTKNLLVKFKAVPYMTAGGTKDDVILKVNVIGPGTVGISQFEITNWPDYAADPNCTEIWKNPSTERSFVITGATAETQIRFLGGDFDLRGREPKNKNRIFLDDVVVTVQE
ncbi:BACON domain-containing protein [Sphingobacterium suaedae]|uniref:BACON domain-containing protein n=1 Tax=Sphingobacterium suaedae TaxID=1686402 RepID=A0ABW5KEU1_9SPHI